jgi:tetratricopeptide (TPR) repeat protein
VAQIKNIEIKDWKGRGLLIALIVVAIAFAWFSVSWQLGNMLAALTPANDPNTKQIADFAQTLSPRDPITNWLKANVEKDVFTPESLAQSVTDFEQTVRTAPNDYRYWIELGRVYEQSEQFDKAEKAFQQAIKLAPNYSVVHWQIGNFYLRQGRETDAFAELRKSAESSALYGEQVFSIVWEYFDKDTAKLEQLAGDNADVRAGLTKFYAVKERPEDSLRIWNTLSAEDKQRNQAVTRIIAQSLYEKRYFRSSIEFVRQLGIEPQAQSGTVQNGGFEAPISAEAKDVYFGWKVLKFEKIDVNTDPLKKKEGNKSLRVSFNGYAGIELKNITQIVTVEPNKKYRFSFWLKTENLKSAGTPDLEIVNANDEKIITTGAAFQTGTNDWSQVAMEFTAPENAEAVVIRLDRAYCGDACPIVGTIWLDDFKLESN